MHVQVMTPGPTGVRCTGTGHCRTPPKTLVRGGLICWTPSKTLSVGGLICDLLRKTPVWGGLICG
jgi:hypothetical protein